MRMLKDLKKATLRAKQNLRLEILAREAKFQQRSIQHKASNRWKIKQLYGLDFEQFERMKAQQNYVCAICSKHNAGTKYRELSVDHDHKTGKVRALLCGKCNSGLGIFNEDIDLMKKAIEYLHKWSKEGAN